MGPFAALERFFERVFERPTARLFRTRLQPLQLQRRIERAIENGRLSSADRVFVPNRFIVRLNPSDVDAFGELVPDLERELATSALNYARAHRYTLADRPDVRLQADPSVGGAEVVVQARFVDDEGVRDARAGQAAAFGVGGGPPSLAPDLAFPQLTPEQMTRTMVFQVPYVDAPVAILREYGARRQPARDHRRWATDDPRPLDRQRDRRPRFARLAPSRAAAGPPGRARLQRPRQHERLARERRRDRRGRARARAIASRSGTRCSSWSRCPTPDGRTGI